MSENLIGFWRSFLGRGDRDLLECNLWARALFFFSFSRCNFEELVFTFILESCVGVFPGLMLSSLEIGGLCVFFLLSFGSNSIVYFYSNFKKLSDFTFFENNVL